MAKRKKRLKPPPELSGDALIEWHRVCAELNRADRLDAIDRSLLVLYAQTHATYRAAAAEVMATGAIKVFEHNGMVGVSPHYRVMKEAGRQLRGLLNDSVSLRQVARSSRPKSIPSR